MDFEFNAWGERYLPYDRDALVPAAIAAHLGVRRYAAPFVLEGGSIFVDGEGTLLTTEQCLLNPNRNPALSRADIERGLRDYLGAEVVVWLGQGHSADRDTDGHVDGVAQYVRPGGREIVPVPGRTLNEGGGGPHCITQQIPAGTMVSP